MMFGATAILATTSAEDLRLSTVERVRPLPETGHFSDKVSENSIDIYAQMDRISSA